MALSPTAAWREACQGGAVRWRYLLEITDGTTTWKCLDGSVDSASDLAGEPVAINDVSAISAEMDPLTRQPAVSSFTVNVSDAWLRPIIVNNRIKGQKGTLKIGAAGLSDADFLVIAIGPIESFDPHNGTDIDVEIVDVFTLMERTAIVGAWFGRHPLQVLQDIADRADIATAYIDTASLDPADAANTSIGHYVVSRGPTVTIDDNGNQLRAPQNALKLSQEVGQLLNGSYIAQENGKLTFKRFDATASAVANWSTTSNIIPGSVRQISVDDNVVNRVSIKFGKAVDGAEGLRQHAYRADDTASQSNRSYPGTTRRILEQAFQTDWLESYPLLAQNQLLSTDTSMIVGNDTHSFAGTRDIMGTPPAEAALSASKPAYLMIVSLFSENVFEIVKSTTISSTDGVGYVELYDPGTGVTTTKKQAGTLTFGSLTRGALGTTAKTWAGFNVVVDVTMLVDLGDALLKRFVDGAPIIELNTPLSEIEYQVTDFVALTVPEFVGFGLDGLDGTEKFEIISKEIDRSSSTIRWVLVHVVDNAITRIGSILPGARSLNTRAVLAGQASTAVDPYVVSGLTVSDGGGFSATIAAGFASNGLNIAELPSAVTYSVSASEDTYVAFHTVSSAITFHSVANGQPQPDKLDLEVWLAKVVSDGSGITSVVSLQVTTPINGNRLVAATVASTELASAAVTTAKIAASAVTSNEVANDTIGISNTAVEYERGISLFIDPGFSLYTRG